jgi:hypothetical protein
VANAEFAKSMSIENITAEPSYFSGGVFQLRIFLVKTLWLFWPSRPKINPFLFLYLAFYSIVKQRIEKPQ